MVLTWGRSPVDIQVYYGNQIKSQRYFPDSVFNIAVEVDGSFFFRFHLRAPWGTEPYVALLLCLLYLIVLLVCFG